ncbi:MAG: hypothetical protein RBS13_01500, partial [Bacteroidales bacterium]|nr:hypothetical protein [Bacteroidales bacterium]
LPSWGDLEGCSLKTMMFEKYPSISPYTYCANNPVMFVDPTGKEIDVTSLPQEVRNKLITSLNKITGLNLKAEKNEKGLTMLTYSGEVNEEGTSKTARNLLMNAIDDKSKKIEVFYMPGKGSKGGGLQIQYDDKQIQGFIDGVRGGLNPETMGFGMTFLHELDHTDLGITKSRDGENRIFGEIGSTVKLMNTIRAELGADYGERLSHASSDNPMDNYNYIPFDGYSLGWLKKGFAPINNKYIEIKK